MVLYYLFFLMVTMYTSLPIIFILLHKEVSVALRVNGDTLTCG
jgi:hypothetical protein